MIGIPCWIFIYTHLNRGKLFIFNSHEPLINIPSINITFFCLGFDFCCWIDTLLVETESAMDCGRLLKPILTREELCVSRKLCDAQHIVFLWSDKFFSFFGKYYDFSENCIEIIYTGIHTLMTNFFFKIHF